eukprot:4200962-Pleurochrysis_carterae.AAC.2
MIASWGDLETRFTFCPARSAAEGCLHRLGCGLACSVIAETASFMDPFNCLSWILSTVSAVDSLERGVLRLEFAVHITEATLRVLGVRCSQFSSLWAKTRGIVGSGSRPSKPRARAAGARRSLTIPTRADKASSFMSAPVAAPYTDCFQRLLFSPTHAVLDSFPCPRDLAAPLRLDRAAAASPALSCVMLDWHVQLSRVAEVHVWGHA